MKLLTALAVLLFFSVPVPARDLDGIQIPDTLSVTGEKTPLTLNGAGYRKKFFVKVYIGALYLSQPASQASAALKAGTARVMRLYFLRDVSQDKLSAAWIDSIAANHSVAEMQALRARVDQLNNLIGSVREKDVLQIEMHSRGETRVLLNDQLRGSIDGADFQSALLTAWIGATPADAGLKKAVLGGKE